MGQYNTIWIFLLPLTAFIVNATAGSKMPGRTAGWIATLAMAGAAICSWTAAWKFFFEENKVLQSSYFTWLKINPLLTVDIGIYADRLTWLMMAVVTTVSLLVFIYSIDYMKGEPGYSRFFALLSLFGFSMLGLVAAPNLIQLYMCWELVGLSSYLLIGFYFTRPAAVAASKKAFIVTRFADFGFLTGILLLSHISGTLQIDELNRLPESAAALPQQPVFAGLSTLTWAMILIFAGGAGKSAMFPLHIWLPDAMEGPTPVSALIHAATMVVAGVFLVARLFPLYNAFAPSALDLIAGVGAFSLLFAALIACTQTDIKRILAYSTMSQIGYMMLALGAGAFSASIFHLFTHAFFKALLFLASGVIIHAVHTQQINAMGGLRKSLPFTHLLFLIACLAISGIPPFAGFFSKDEILNATYAYSPVHFYVALAGAGLTAFYMFRLYFMVFWRQPATVYSPSVSMLMIVPMITLGLASATAGFFPITGKLHNLGLTENTAHFNFMPWLATGIAAAGIAAAAWIYINKREVQPPDNALYRIVRNKFYIDEIYLFITKNIIFQKLALPIAWFDRHVVDGTMNALARITQRISEEIKYLQSGQLQQYAWVFAAGTLALVLMAIFMQTG